MARARRRRALMGIFMSWCALIVSVAAVWQGQRADAAASDTALTSVAVPYLGTTTIEPGPGWQISDCETPRAATTLVTECDATKLTLTATAYDPDAGATLVPVPQSNGSTSVVFQYTVTLAPPERPTVTGGPTGFPVAAGSTVMLPLSDLGVECPVCAEGGAVEVVAVEPRSAGTAAATGTHVVFRPSAAYSGSAGIVVRYADDYGTWSPDATIEVPVYRPSSPLVATSVFAAIEGTGQQAVDLRELVFGADAGELHFIGCGAAVHGTVVCASDGTAIYIPSGASVDQFSYHVASANGEQATGSVTLVGGSSELPNEGMVPASAVQRGDDGVPSMIVPRVPVEAGAGSDDGIFSPLIETLDRVGAR